MTTRITERMIMSRSFGSLQTGLGRLAKSQEQLSSGRLINRPSDSPTGTNQAMQLRSALAAKAQYATNAQDGTAWLNSTDSTLQSMLDSTTVARGLMLQGSNSGSMDSDARQALATSLKGVRDDLLGQANTQYLGRPLFGGTTGGSVAYDSTGAFVGDEFAISRTVGEGQEVPVNVTGPTTFSAGGKDLFAVLDSAITALTADPSQLGTSLTDLDAVTTSMKSALSDIGTRGNRIDAATTALANTTLDTKTALSGIEDVDVASAIVDLQMQQVAYQASLGATAKVIQPSLLDFLR